METITDIRQLPYSSKRFDLYLDHEYFYTVHKNTLASMNIAAGFAVENREDFKNSCFEDELKQAVESALKYLSMSRTRTETLRKLASMKYDNKIAAEVIRKLEAWGYLSDDKYAADFISIYSKAGYGRYALVKKLEQKGIAFDGQVQDEFENALSFAKKKMRMHHGEKAVEKTARALFQRGFSTETIRKVLSELGDTGYEE